MLYKIINCLNPNFVIQICYTKYAVHDNSINTLNNLLSHSNVISIT